MKKIYPILSILFLVAYTSSCERDDICVDGDTPLLVIGFFDIDDTTTVKSVSSIRIRATDIDSVLSDNESFGFSDRGNTGSSPQDSILIPLRTDEINTSFTFITDSADDDAGLETGNIDTLTISYTTRENFISRGCGFVINYDTLDVQLTLGSENWIQDISIQQQTIENSNNVHVKIFH
ncbi:DUF6452 family protein [Flagellimonas sp.]|uniref:DUF6452 family protein n=1 Tax=Flagellimonas sp. TaxID=2058762 RepID=UPI003F49E9EC